jgi:hypothetical protein
MSAPGDGSVASKVAGELAILSPDSKAVGELALAAAAAIRRPEGAAALHLAAAYGEPVAELWMAFEAATTFFRIMPDERIPHEARRAKRIAAVWMIRAMRSAGAGSPDSPRRPVLLMVSTLSLLSALRRVGIELDQVSLPDDRFVGDVLGTSLG